MIQEKRFHDYNDAIQESLRVRGDDSDLVKARIPERTAMYILNNNTNGKYAKYIIPCPEIAREIEEIFTNESNMLAVLRRNNSDNYLITKEYEAISARLGLEGEVQKRESKSLLGRMWNSIKGKSEPE